MAGWLQMHTNPFSLQRRKSRYAELDFEVGPCVPSAKHLGPGVLQAPGGAAQAGPAGLEGLGSGAGPDLEG